MSWHADEALLSDYLRGAADQRASAQLEAHLITCAACRAYLAGLVDPECLKREWDAVRSAINTPRRGLLEALLVKAGMADTTARLVAVTPSLRASWIAAVTVALGFAVVAAYQSVNGLLLFLVIAPLLPVIGVAAAYGPGVDPTYEIGLAAPFNSFRLLLVRAGAVLTATTTLAGLTGLMLPHLDRTAVAWLLPALGLTLGSLALSTVVTPLRAAHLTSLGWLVTVAAVTAPAHDRLLLFDVGGQVVFALLAAACGVIVARRRGVIEQEKTG